MTAQEWAGTLRRRWYVLAAVLLCTMGGLWAVHGRSITYRGCDELFLSAPPQPWNRNAITGQNASVPMVAGMVSGQLNSAPVRHQLQAAGVTQYYNVLMTNTGEVRFPAYTSPTLHICVSSTSPQAVLTATTAASRKFESLLYAMQADRQVHAKSMITVNNVAQAVPRPITGQPGQAYFGIVLIGLLAGVALVFWTDPLLTRWRYRRPRVA